MTKILQIALLVCLVSLAVLVSGFYYAQNRDFFFPHISQLLTEGTGFQMQKIGPLVPGFYPQLSLTAHSPDVTNPASQTATRILKAKSVTVSLPWESLFQPGWVLDIVLDSGELDLQIDSAGHTNWTTEARLAEGDDLPLSIGLLEAWNTRVHFENQQSGDTLDLGFDHINADLTTKRAEMQLDTHGQISHSQFTANGQLHYSDDSRSLMLDLSIGANFGSDLENPNQQQPGDDMINVAGPEKFLTTGRLSGVLSIRDKLPFGSLDFSADTRHIEALVPLLDELQHLKPDVGPVAGSGSLRVHGSDLDIEGLKISHRTNQLDVTVEGTVLNILSDAHAQLEISGRGSRLEQVLSLQTISQTNIPALHDIEEISIGGELTSSAYGTSVSNLEFGFRHRGMTSKIRGELNLKPERLLSQLEVNAQVSDINDLTALFGMDNRPFHEQKPFTLSARLSTENKKIKLEHCQLQGQDNLFKASISGSLSLEENTLAFDLHPALDSTSFESFLPMIPQDYRMYLSGLGGKASASLSGTTDLFSASKVNFNLVRNNNHLMLGGEIRHLPSNPELNLTVDYMAQQPTDLEQYFPELGDKQLAAPLSLKGGIRWRDKQLNIENILLKAPGNDLSGRVSVDLGASPAKIDANVNASVFTNKLVTAIIDSDPDATPVVDIESDSADTQTQQPRAAEQIGEHFQTYIKNIEIDTSWISELDLTFSFLAAEAHINEYDLSQLSLALNARDGVFKLLNYELVLDDKPISLTGQIDTRKSPPTYALNGTLSGDTLEDLLNAESELVQGGVLNGELELESKGATIGELIHNLNGTVLLTMGPLTIQSGILNRVSSSLTSTILNGVVRRDKETQVSRYDCGILGIDLDGGIANINRTFTMEASDYNLAGFGQIDLNTGALDIRVVPKAKEGLGLSISSVVGGFRVRGNLATPDFGLGGGLLNSLIAGYALSPAVATGIAVNPATATIVATGIAITGFFDRITASGYSCENTLNRFERNQEWKDNPPLGNEAPTPFF